MKIRSKLTLLLLVLSFLILTAAGIFSSLTIERNLRTRIVSELRTGAKQVDYHLRSWTSPIPDTGAYDRLRAYARTGEYRLTLIRRDGVVIFDSDIREGDLGGLENHAGRPEVMEALRGRIGTSTRHSATIGQDLLYVARPVIPPIGTGGKFGATAVIRVSIPLTDVDAAISEVRTNIVAVSALVFGVVVIVVGFASRRLSSPIAAMAKVAAHVRAGDLDRRITVRSRDELGKLGETINGMLETLRADIVQLRKLERVRTEFLGNVSHELRTPIFAIQGMLETLLDGAVDDPDVNRDFLKRALRNTENLNTLLNDLIEISRIESGEMKMSFRFFDLGDFLRNVMAEMEPAANLRGIRLTGEISKERIEVYGDRNRLRQVMVNLLDNAVKYNVDGGTVTVTSSKTDGKVEILVTDTGVGIPPEHLPRIFERFYRVDRERSRSTGGTGLGLAIVKHIVEAHGGTIQVVSRIGEGTSVSVQLHP